MSPPRRVIVTGTNGKTSTTWRIAAIAAAAGDVPAYVSSVGHAVGGEPTRDAAETWRRATARGARACVIEATSYALSRGLAALEPPDVAVLLRVTRDHLDVHGTAEAYLAAKAQAFLALRPGGHAVLHATDPASRLVRELVPAGVAVHAWALDDAEERIGETVARAGGAVWRLRTTGRASAENAAAAAVAARCLGYGEAAVREGLEVFAGVPGRFEVLGRAPLRVVDYAHTPDALAHTLATARRLVRGRVLLVFGCGGDRDAGKRAEMGDVAALGADRVVLTTDNPRSEDPAAIARAVRGHHAFVEVPDRAAAIALACGWADPDDAVLLCGKGHEEHQELAGGPVPFSDRVALGARP